MDALITELQNGTVTLRKRRRPEDFKNPSLKELFETLEQSQKQNRSSKTLLIGYNFVTRATSEQF